MSDGMPRDKWLYGEKDDDELKEMKVLIPLEYYLKLHGLKILNNQTIKTSVLEALRLYFATSKAAAAKAPASDPDAE